VTHDAEAQPQPGVASLAFETMHWDGSANDAAAIGRWAREQHGVQLGLWDGNWNREPNSWNSIGKFMNGSLLPGGTALWLPPLGLFALTPELLEQWLAAHRSPL
jgi:hypothetical protein